MAHTFNFLFLISALFSIVWAREIQFENCGGVVKSVSVEPCLREPCEIPKGSSAIITVRCLSNVNAEKLRLSVWADVSGIELPYPGMRRDACRGKNLTCPITNNQELQYVQKFEVKKFFPNVQTIARFNLKTNDDQDKTVCCFRAPVNVVDSVQ
ncbi:NPC intracellular cholesterol transporter 2-like [Stegodyphus dumicola]|uniref:NPC intracellular cholesterol transporter 2-like n=1 Tax=Stegodyphus dumicola TaxID=202533 RepID=UPI0015B1893F|nr:NPC intracellular cholesterol transporter 2-like [Stegodyphus dumicola]